MDLSKDLVAASSTPFVLSILAEGDSYGYAILRRVRELSGGEIEWTDGMLYPALHRLERLGHIEARWEVAETGRQRSICGSRIAMGVVGSVGTVVRRNGGRGAASRCLGGRRRRPATGGARRRVAPFRPS